ncbi:MAG: hypothetical protein DHS20C16_09900 [Phycisphaerae bacterium]|nr:MAG: hypothetical protein DHS20C16_09900 [Phycisphaerae bacterium]
MTSGIRTKMTGTRSLEGDAGDSELSSQTHMHSRAESHERVEVAGVTMRHWPYPYRAMLAVCSDLDETPDRNTYWDTAEFLNTKRTTPMGEGLGLEVGNTIYFDMAADQFAYWNTDDVGRTMVQSLIRSGHIDCLHSFGDLATTREHAQRALDELEQNGCHLDVWIDHAQAITNFDGGIMMGEGDASSSPAYHADLTVKHGVQFVWRGRVSSVLGQDVPPQLGGILSPAHPIASGKTFAKELSKQMLSRMGNEKYAMHAPNRILTRSTLRDGQPVYEFLRCNPHWGGVSSHETAWGFGDVLTDRMIAQLVDREGGCILYTHLGKSEPDAKVPLGTSAIDGFRRLATAQADGNLLVTTTRRLLGFCRAKEEIGYEATRCCDSIVIDIDTTKNRYATLPEIIDRDLEGLTFYTPDAGQTSVRIDGEDVPQVMRNAADATGRASVSIPWSRLEFPER